MASATAFRGLFSRSAFIRQSAFRQIFQRRAQSTASAADAGAAEGGNYFTKLWNSPVGPKTVHFWAPIMKWGVVISGASDFARPAESLSLSQNAALTCTGIIWTRWCFIIKPRNLFLASVNAALGLVGAVQVGRIINYQQSQTDEPLAEQAKQAAEQIKDKAESVAKDPVSAVKPS